MNERVCCDDGPMTSRPLVFKFGGELIEDASRMKTAATAIAAAARTTPLVVIHGGGREIDAALKRTGIEPQQVDGLRITDAATLDVVVAVLAGAVNTRFVAALNTAGVAAVGLTGADAKCGLSQRAPAHRRVDGRTVDLGHVGVPTDRADARHGDGRDDREAARLRARAGRRRRRCVDRRWPRSCSDRGCDRRQGAGVGNACDRYGE